MGAFFNNLLGGLGTTISDFINGLVVGALTFIDNVLSFLDSLKDVIVHAVSSIGNLTSALTTLGSSLFPMIPEEWRTLILAALLVLAVGLLIRKKVSS